MPIELAPVERVRMDRRLVDAALACIARWGVAKTSLEDVAKEARCSRATVYRAFPGGKDALLEAVAAVEVECFFQCLATRLDAASNLEDLLVAGMTEAVTQIDSHSALQYLLANEPELLLPRMALSGMDRILRVASDFATPYLERWLNPEAARRAAEWVTRLVLSYASCPATEIDITEPEAATRQLVQAFVLPGIRAMADGPPAGGSGS